MFICVYLIPIVNMDIIDIWIVIDSFILTYENIYSTKAFFPYRFFF